MDFQYEKYIKKWKNSQVDGNRGILARNVSGHIIRYLRETYGEACSICLWNQKNITTGRVPLEIDHLDGDSENSSVSNLRLICPNCHSLAEKFRNLNKGKGRRWRRQKYIKNI